MSILQRAFGSQDKTSGSAVNKNKNVDSKHKQEVLYYRMNPLSCVCEDTNDYYKWSAFICNCPTFTHNQHEGIKSYLSNAIM